MDEGKSEINRPDDWREGLTPEQIAFTEAQGIALKEYLESLDADPDSKPSPQETTSMKIEMEKRGLIKPEDD